MSDTPKTAEQALAALRNRAAEHEESQHVEYREYAAGIRDAITALEPFLKAEAVQKSPPSKEAKRLTKIQEEVIGRLNAGWELGVIKSATERRVWLQKNGVFTRGENMKVLAAVFDSLLTGGFVAQGKSSDPEVLVYVLAPGVQA